MMADLYIRLPLAALVIIGLWNATGPGMILEGVGHWLERAPKWFAKPMGLCPPCMAGVHGSWMWLITGGHWTGLPIFILALSGLLVLVVKNLLTDGTNQD
jgi:hypothetical protein